MKNKIILIRSFLSAAMATVALVALFQNCAPMQGMLPIDQMNAEESKINLANKLIGQPLMGKVLLNTCGDAPDFPEDAMCAQWHSSAIDGYISIAVQEDGSSFAGTSTCFDYTGSFEVIGDSYKDKRDVLITPATFVVDQINSKADAACTEQIRQQEQSRIELLTKATGFSFYSSGSIGIETPSGRLLLK